MTPLRIRTMTELALTAVLGLPLTLTGHPFDNDRQVTPAEAADIIAADIAEIFTRIKPANTI